MKYTDNPCPMVWGYLATKIMLIKIAYDGVVHISNNLS